MKFAMLQKIGSHPLQRAATEHSREKITAEATTMRLMRTPRLRNQKLMKPGVRSIARTLLRYTYAKIAAKIVERREHSDEVKAYVLNLQLAPCCTWEGLTNCKDFARLLREMKGVEHRLKLHPGSTFRHIYQKARGALDLPACKSSTSLSLFYSENLLGASRPCTWEALAQVPCHDCLCSMLLGGTVLGVVTYK